MNRKPIFVTVISFCVLFTFSGNLTFANSISEIPGRGAKIADVVTADGTVLSAAAYEGIVLDGSLSSNVASENVLASQKLYYPLITGGYMETIIHMQNVGAGSTTQLEIWFYDSPSDTSPTIISRPNLPSGATQSLWVSTLGQIPEGFRGSAIVVSDQPIIGVAEIFYDDNDRSMIYSAFNQGFESLILPSASKNFEGWNTLISAQNIGDNATTATFSFYNSSGAVLHIINQTLQPGASYVVDLSVVSALGGSFSGWVNVSSSGGSLISVALDEHSDSDGGAAYNGIPAGSINLISPRQQKGVDSWYSSTLLVNNNFEEVNFSMDFINQDGESVWLNNTTISSTLINYDIAEFSEIPDGFNGGLIMDAVQPLAGLTNWSKPDQVIGDTYASVGLLNQSSGKLAFPYAPHSISQLMSSEFSIQNTGNEQADVSINFIDQNGNVVYTKSENIPANGIKLLDTNTDPMMVDEFNGGVIVESPGNTIAGYVTVLKRSGFEYFLPAILKASCLPLYSDDFSNSSSGWPIGDNGDSRFEYLNGEYRILIREYDYSGFAIPGFQATDYTLVVDVRNATGIYGSYGLVFGLSDYDNQLYSFEVENDGYYSIWRYNDSNGWLLLTDGWSSAINQGTNSNHLKVVRDGTKINAYANGTLLESISDGTYTGSRYVGVIVTSYDQANVDVRFDNFEVYSVSCSGEVLNSASGYTAKLDGITTRR